MENNTVDNFFCPHFYTELSCNKLDFINLAERCELLTQILLDCENVQQMRPIFRCLGAYLDALQQSLNESMSDFRVAELTVAESLPEFDSWLLDDSFLQCQYCQALNQALLKSTLSHSINFVLAGLLHQLVSYMTKELKLPRFVLA
ncbi:hypothetical protein NLN94_10505 [Citrobacter portucalensis]|uniref:hypothetical protein n=1 Tax=Citrobacter portucalensis TaxID=1639133 RepID=UPI00226B0CF1|nr:hypothetical protein [Citrobacter portucalensis]MCX9061367.1 hypothetical protein [Citrobacter portucalensis]